MNEFLLKNTNVEGKRKNRDRLTIIEANNESINQISEEIKNSKEYLNYKKECYMKNLGSLKNEIAKMKCGDIITITFMYKNNNSEDMDEIITELAKTRWMDSYTYLLGGTCDEVIGLKASDPDDLSEDELLKEAQLVVDKIIEIKEPDDIVFSNDGYRVEIHAYGGCLRSCEMDNMVYHK